MRCLVTGGAGFIGTHIVTRLLKDGHKVVSIDNYSSGRRGNEQDGCTYISADVQDMEFWGRRLEKMNKIPEIVFHLAAFPRVEPSIEQPLHSHNMNVNTTIHLLEFCREHKVKRVVLTSSSAVYGEAKIPTHESMKTDPMSPYALNKLMNEQYCKMYSDLYDLSTVCLRYSNAYGEGQPTEGAYCNVMGIFEQQKAKGEKLTIVGNGEQRRDFIYVGDIVEANIQVAFYESPLIGATLNVGYGKNYSVNQIAEWIGGETTNIPPRVEPKETLLDSSQMMECFDWKPTMDLEKWIGNRMNKEKPASRKQAEKRLEYLNTELSHERYWDGWSVQGMKEEKEWLETH